METYRAPYHTREARLPLLIWPRELPIEGEPADVVAIVSEYGEWLSRERVAEAFHPRNPGQFSSAERANSVEHGAISKRSRSMAFTSSKKIRRLKSESLYRALSEDSGRASWIPLLQTGRTAG